MATFLANPNRDNEPWIEQFIFDDYPLRIWHFMFFCFAGFTILVVFICCCVKFRVPRTKLDIEGDYRRRKLAEKFKEKLTLIRNQDIDAIDLQAALRIIQHDFDEENIKIDREKELLSAEIEENVKTIKAGSPSQSKYAKKFADIMLASKINANDHEK